MSDRQNLGWPRQKFVWPSYKIALVNYKKLKILGVAGPLTYNVDPPLIETIYILYIEIYILLEALSLY
jgi:hypothetical protein